MSNRILIACYFGHEQSGPQKAPHNLKSYFFTNNSGLREIIESRGWIYRYVDFPLVDDEVESAIQSKYIKFLQFLRDYTEFLEYEQIIYSDHKLSFSENTTLYLDKVVDTTKFITIRNTSPSIWSCGWRSTPRLKETINDEIIEAMFQTRYCKNMSQTMTWKHNFIEKHKLTNRNRIMNTGLIVYNQYNNIMNLLNETYNVICQLKQPECQVIWACTSQPYEKFIQRLDFFQIDNPPSV